jgi:hypothetical protein
MEGRVNNKLNELATILQQNGLGLSSSYVPT